MFGTLPGLFLVEFGGEWENEPGNGCTTYLNPNQVTVVKPHIRDSNGVVTHFILHIVDQEYGFIVQSELQLVPGEKEDPNAIH